MPKIKPRCRTELTNAVHLDQILHLGINISLRDKIYFSSLCGFSLKSIVIKKYEYTFARTKLIYCFISLK